MGEGYSMTTNIKIIQGDAVNEMSKLPDGGFDCIVTDPPYWTLDKWRSIGTTTRLGGGRGGEVIGSRRAKKT